MRKKRGYNRETPLKLVRDYKLFAIACEGDKTEPKYFNTFKHLSKKIAVDVIQDVVSEDEAISINPNKSAPRWVLDRALRYIEKEGLNDEDELWFVMDIDRWEESQLREIAQHCDDNPNWHIVLSNPCFETWLYYHKTSNIENVDSITCKELKHELSKFNKQGYHPYDFIKNLPEAIKNSKNADSNPDYYFPDKGVTKVYKLGEALLSVIGVNDFQNFIDVTLVNLIKKRI